VLKTLCDQFAAETNLQLKSLVYDIKLSPHLINQATPTPRHGMQSCNCFWSGFIWVPWGIVSAAEMNIENPPEEINIRLCPNFTWFYLRHNRRNTNFQMVPTWLAYVSRRGVFCGKISMILQIWTNASFLFCFLFLIQWNEGTENDAI